jgi:diaminopimelate epimerase
MVKLLNIPFSKMHGAGNDFVVINQMNRDFHLTSFQIKKMADRNFGIGFDQLLIIEEPTQASAEFKYRIFNADGGEVGQCGNGARCFFHYLKIKNLSSNNEITVETQSGVIVLSYKNDGLISVDMGVPVFDHEKIPFISINANVPSVTVDSKTYEFFPLSMGNPHAVIKLPKLTGIDLVTIGKALQRSPAFPESVNVGFVQVIDKHTLSLKVYERGSGMTLACGSGACAAAVIAVQNQWVQGPVNVLMDGGQLTINLTPKGSIELMGPAEWVFDGELNISQIISHDE